MANLQELIAQRAELERKIAAMQGEARAEAVAKVRALMAEFGLTAADLGGRVSTSAAKEQSGVKRPAPVKYRDTAGNTWSGRGLRPKWLVAAVSEGKSLEDFAV